MTTKELNRDIKKLAKALKASSDACNMVYDNPTSTSEQKNNAGNAFFKFKEESNHEFKRLYFASDNFKYCTKETVLILMVLNLRYRFIHLHSFGTGVEID